MTMYGILFILLFPLLCNIFVVKLMAASRSRLGLCLAASIYFISGIFLPVFVGLSVFPNVLADKTELLSLLLLLLLARMIDLLGLKMLFLFRAKWVDVVRR